MTLNGHSVRELPKEQYPGAALLHFRFLFKKAEEVLRVLNYPSLASPYTLIPLLSQAIGLDVPMMGSGKSPYSIISYFSKLDKNIFLNKNDNFSYEQRRGLIDEVYDMISPHMIGDESGYINLLVATKYKDKLANLSRQEIDKFIEIFKKKFHILGSFLSKLKFVGGHYSHIAHYGYLDDLYREQDFLRGFDKQTARLWRENSFPIVTEMQIDGFNAPNKSIRGWYIFIPNYTEELLRDKNLRQKKILQAVNLAKKLNAPFVGMAGLIASFSKGGRLLSDNVKDMGFTTGHAYTVANIYEICSSIANVVSLDLARSCVAVVGAAGSIGGGVAKLLSETNIKELLLVDMPNMVSAAKLSKLEFFIKKTNSEICIRTSTAITSIRDADLIVIATNSPTSIIEERDLKHGAIVIDDSFPKNVSRQLLKERDDVILLEGGVSQLPKTLNVDVSRNIPDLLDLSISKLISCKQAYGCLCETFILAAYKHKGNYGLGDADPTLAKEIVRKGKQLGFTKASFQNYGFVVEETRIKKVKEIITKKSK